MLPDRLTVNGGTDEKIAKKSYTFTFYYVLINKCFAWTMHLAWYKTMPPGNTDSTPPSSLKNVRP